MRSSAPPRGAGRDSAPPSWRSSTNSSSGPGPGAARARPATRWRVSGRVVDQDAVGVGSRRFLGVELEVRRWRLRVAPRRCRSPDRSDRSGASTSLRRTRPSIEHDGVDDHELPSPDAGRQRRIIGCLEQPGDAGDACPGSCSAQAAHAVSTSRAWVQSHTSIPVYAVRTGNRSNSSAVTTPNPPPPPRAAHSRSVPSSSSVARTKVPSASTSSAAVIALHCSPCCRAIPAQAAAERRPDHPHRWGWTCAGGEVESPGARDDVTPQHPAPTRAVRRSASIRSSVMAEVRSRTASSRCPASGGAPCPVPCGATLSPAAAAARSTAVTSLGKAG